MKLIRKLFENDCRTQLHTMSMKGTFIIVFYDQITPGTCIVMVFDICR